MTIPTFHRQHPRVHFTPAEDAKLTSIIIELGTNNWEAVARCVHGRNARQCRDRWSNYLFPEMDNGPWRPDEDQLLFTKFNESGAVWKYIATFVHSRSDINIKSRRQLLTCRMRRQFSKEAVAASQSPHSVVQMSGDGLFSEAMETDF
jgi:hypothetical protein